MENQLPEPPSIPVTQRKQPFLIIVSLVLAAILITVAFYYLQIKKSTSSSINQSSTTQQQKPTLTPTSQTITSADLENCQVKKQSNPLVDNLMELSDGTVIGTFRGNINNINTASKYAQIELVSPKADQIHTFNVKPEKGLVNDAVNLKEIALNDLKQGQTLVISFNCFPKNNPGNKFKITKIDLTSKR